MKYLHTILSQIKSPSPASLIKTEMIQTISIINFIVNMKKLYKESECGEVVSNKSKSSFTQSVNSHVSDDIETM